MDANNKLIYISVFNHGAIDLARNHLKSLVMQGITNYKGYCTCVETETQLIAEGFNVEKVNYEMDEAKHSFGSEYFNKLSYLRYVMMLNLLKKGHDVWYMDVDTVVCGNLNSVYQQIVQQNIYNAVFQSDVNMLCTGCMLFRSHPSTIKCIYEQYISSFKNTHPNDQTLFNYVINKLNDPELKVSIFPPFQFPNGLIFFGDDFVKTQVPQYIELRRQFHASPKNVMFVHANWMIGIDTKINAFKAYNLWK